MVNMLRGVVAVASCTLAVACALSAPGHQASPAGAGLVVHTLAITENGAASPAVDPGECRGFVLDERTVRWVLEESEPISRDQYMHQLPWSPCLVRGRLVLADGREGTWTIRRYGTGSVLFDDGGEWFLLCATCTRPPFVPIE